MRIKPRITITLSREELRIIAKYGFRNKSVWLGERVREWYRKNIDEIERLKNKLRWRNFEKIEIEDDMKVIAGGIEKLEAERTSQTKVIIHRHYRKKR